MGLAFAAALGAVGPAAAGGDRDFFRKIEGTWSGPGQIIAGKYKGTRFNCTLDGSSIKRRPGMMLEGTCRVGLFSQSVSARIERRGRSYKGSFLDGAKGKGLDVVAGNVTEDRVTVSMQREALNGAMVTRLKPNGKLGVTVSVRVGEDYVPVIGIDLARALDRTAVGSTR